MNDFINWISENAKDRNFAVVFLGIFGGFVRMLNDPDISFRKFLAGVCTAGFVSVLVALGMADFDLPFSLKGFFIGISGYSGTAALDVLTKSFLKRLQKLAEEKEDQK
jgi:hypothetical protein